MWEGDRNFVDIKSAASKREKKKLMKKPRIAVSAALTALISTGKRVLVYGAQKIGSDFNDTTISNNYRRQYGASSLVTVFIRVSCRVLFERR